MPFFFFGELQLISFTQALTNQLLSNVHSRIPFYNICSLTYFHIKVPVRVDEAENVLHAFL